MEPTNPYSPPASPLSAPPRPGGGPEGVGPATLESLRATKPWVRLLSVLGFIFSVFAVLLGLAMMVGGGSGFMGDEFQGALGIGMGIFYLVFALLYIMPSLYLWRYASAIQTLLSSRRYADLDAALLQQKSFWRFVGILTAAVLVIYVVGIVLAVLFGALGAVGALSGG